MRPEKPRETPLGIYLSQKRGEMGYSVTELAKMSQISPSGVTEVELDIRQLTGPTARRLAGPLGITPNELLIRANLTPELPWEQAVSNDEESMINLNLQVTKEEELQITEFLYYLRFRRWISVKTE